MHCAILKLASEPLIGLDRLLSLVIQETTDRRLSDHPPPTASRTRGQKVTPAWVHWEAILTLGLPDDERRRRRDQAGPDPGGDRRQRGLVGSGGPAFPGL